MNLTKKELLNQLSQLNKYIMDHLKMMDKISKEVMVSYGIVRMLEETNTFADNCLKLTKSVMDQEIIPKVKEK